MSPQTAARADLFSAIADPRRRRILELLRSADRTVGELTADLGIAQPSVSQHLRLLADLGLVASTRRGTSSVYRLTPEPLATVRDWVDAQSRPSQ
ncbi:DNA-binding transcriptional ArsR family regulator [Diaminobutyricimonas aerilata]|uniref:DNA-binding transcriptional ArsR family regulator n=1 Tax=Diaminobutyricimonas aerilata TaxID=1162967 RepID=A0A2M9CIH0_9MICO|nr:metalloregulator ArsR/SmtB family transcription factor [Diaminobutyricimonas aerilata]PJJ71687.1 DNA-binding transcriptional ArsR family regulator [Diaminobutyricimonas aerilata]